MLAWKGGIGGCAQEVKERPLVHRFVVCDQQCQCSGRRWLLQTCALPDIWFFIGRTRWALRKTLSEAAPVPSFSYMPWATMLPSPGVSWGWQLNSVPA